MNDEQKPYNSEVSIHGPATDADATIPTPDASPTLEEPPKPGDSPRCRHGVLRRCFKALLCVVMLILLIPVLIYIPPVQAWLKDIACGEIRKSTGMQAEIDVFRLRFPLDVQLDGVKVIDIAGDTMVMARQALVDVKLLPLLDLEVKINKLHLLDGYYRMVSKDSSMILTMRAADMETNDKSSFNIAAGDIILDKVKLSGGALNLYMDVWRQEHNPPEPGTLAIMANDVDISDFAFAMSMRPTIDTLTLAASVMKVKNAAVDLRNNKIDVEYASLDGGSAKYLTPTADYIATHPVPEPSPYESIPLEINVKDISLTNFSGLYATAGVKPAVGFDPSFICVEGLNISLSNFYNRAEAVRLPITRLEGRERSGIQITKGSGMVAVDSTGVTLSDLAVKTLFSDLKADATLTYAAMAMKNNGDMSVDVTASLGVSDINSFLPAAKPFTKLIPGSMPVALNVRASGSVNNLTISKFNISAPKLLSLNASGYIADVMTPKRMKGNLSFSGKLVNPAPVSKMARLGDLPIPPFDVKGEVAVAMSNYSGKFTVTTPQGNVAARGRVGLNSEAYHAEVSVRDLNARYFMPDLGVGTVNATLYADGAGFNPTSPRARTNIAADIQSVEYHGNTLYDINTTIALENGAYDLHLISDNLLLNGEIYASGTVAEDDYSIDLNAALRYADLYNLGITDTINNGSGVFALRATASPKKWLYDVDLDISEVEWQLPDYYLDLPYGLKGEFHAGAESVTAMLKAENIDLDFDAPATLPKLMKGFSEGAALLGNQIEARYVDVELLQATLPQFTLHLDARSAGHLRNFIESSGVGVRHLAMDVENRDKITANASVAALSKGSLLLDTLTLNVDQNNSLLNYKLHIGNNPGNLDEFHQVNVNGYMGGERVSLFLRQQNLQGETGYRLGLTAAVTDSIATIHFTPLKATIAYMPWTFNDDNYVEYGLNCHHIDANLLAQSSDSKISVHSREHEGEEDHSRETIMVDLENIRIQDFLNMSLFGPPVTGAVNANLELGYYDGSALLANGSVGVKDLYYDKTRVGNLDMDIEADVDFNGNTAGKATLLVEGTRALTLHGILRPDSVGVLPGDIGVTLTRFPLSVANPFLDKSVAKLSGWVSGEMDMSGTFAKPLLNGAIKCDSVNVYLPIMGGKLWLDPDTLRVADNVINFKDYNIWGSNRNPLSIDGVVNARDLALPYVDLKMTGKDFMLINNDKRAKSDLYGKIYLDLNATAKGSLNFLDVAAQVSVLKGSDIYYNLSYDDQLATQSSEDVVRFVQFADTVQVAKTDTVESGTAMRISGKLNISNGVQATVNLSGNATDKVQLSPTGQITYNQSYMGDVRMNGQITTGSGYARYSIPLIGEKRFELDPSSYLLWNGTMLNPTLKLSASESMKSTVSSGANNSHVVDFLISVDVTGTLDSPDVLFDLSAENDISIQNELQSMSADQRSNQAMNMLLYGKYMGPGSASSSSADLLTNPLYSFLESQINSWAANNIRGVDLSFGIDSFNTKSNNQSSTTTSYSYQVSKSLFNNKFKIVVGGNYSTDADADENLSQNIISDISFEYMLRQTNSMSMYVKLFRHNDYESILEGEVSEIGVGYVMQRKLSHLRQLLSWLRPKKRKKAAATVTNMVTDSIPTDSILINDPNSR